MMYIPGKANLKLIYKGPSYLLILVLLTLINPGFGQTSLKDIGLEYGPYEVGFAHYTKADSTRTYKRIYAYTNEFTPRPIPVSVWYPANQKATGSKPLEVLTYFQILKEEEEWEHLPDEQLLNWFYYTNTPSNQGHLKEETKAFRNLDPADGSFPVILYAPSYQAASVENFALCEYLASHGYLVISSPSRGTDTRWFRAADSREMETQARDVEFLIAEASHFPGADLNSIGTMGFSFGGLANVVVQMRNRRIKAIVSLDGTERYREELLSSSPFFDLDRFDVPYLHMAQKEIPESVLKADDINPELNSKFIFYDSISKSEAYSLKFHNLTHSYFSSFGVLFEQRDKRQDKSDLEIMESFQWVARYALMFLDAYLKSDPGALSFLRNNPVQNGLADGLISIRFKSAAKKPFRFQDFNELASQRKYENLEALYQATKEKHPDLDLPENALNTLGLQLVFDPENAEQGINVLRFATQRYPNSANLFDSLGEAYLFLGDREKAIENFEKSLELYPQNPNAIQRLKKLKG